jgi:ABC-2 type transport system permease protein
VTQLAYTRYELLRTFRNKRFFFLALGFPVVLYFLIAGPNRNENDLAHTGLSAPLYYMVGLAAFGTMNAMLSAGARIAAERAAGWNRQLRITPLSVRAYFRTKVLTGYMMAVTVLVALYISGIILGVSLSGREWWRMTLLIVIGLIPFAALGVVLGHLGTPDSIGPIMGGSTALLALLGGTWFPVTGGVMQRIAELLPSYWLVQASHVALGGAGWSTKGWIVIAVWTVVLTVLARRFYRRDTKRV